MPPVEIRTPHRVYQAVVERGALGRLAGFLPENAGRVFVVTEEAVWRHHAPRIQRAMAGRPFEVLRFPGGEENKRLASVEHLAAQMTERGGDRTSVVIGFGGGVVNDVAGFLAAIFMRGVPVIQAPTTLLAQVDAAIGGKTGVNLAAGKNLVGAFHQPLAVLIDPGVLATLPEREYRAGLFEILKCGVIRSPELFLLMAANHADVLSRSPRLLDGMIEESVRIKAEVVSADERESDLRRILNFGHTLGHALEAETAYSRFLHGEAVAFGMRAAVYLAEMTGYLSAEDSLEVLNTIDLYGPIPSLEGIRAECLVARLASDKKTIQGRIHFVLPERIGRVRVVSGIDEKLVLAAAQAALA